MMIWSLFIIDLMGLFFYNKIGSIRSIGDLLTTNIIEPVKSTFFIFVFGIPWYSFAKKGYNKGYNIFVVS